MMKKKVMFLFLIIFTFLGVTSQEALACCKKPSKKPVSSQIIITKKDSKTGKGLNNAYFSISDKRGNLIFNMKTSNSGGTISGGVVSGATPGKAYVTGDIQPGTYTLRETKAPEGYKLNQTPQTFTISRGQTVELTMYNDPLVTTGSLKINKVDADTGKALSGAEFSVTDNKGKVQTGVTNVAGVLELANLAAGAATIKETKAPNGYVTTTNIPSVTINVDKQSSVTVKNQKEVLNGSVKITKVDASNGALLAGAVFSVTDAAGKTQTGVTNSAGILEVSNLAVGVATIKETKAPNGYIITSSIPSVTINANKQSSVTVKNEKEVLNGSLKITKVDASNGALLAGAAFSVIDAAGKTQTGITNSAGILEFSNLAVGVATIKETKAPNGYVITSSVPSVTINANKQSSVTVKNEKEVLNGSLKITKVDSSNGAPLAGAAFSVIDAAGKTQTGITNSAGILEFSNLAVGVATIKETKAPANYVLDSKEIKTTINKQAQSSVTVKNSKVTRWLEIEAIDTSGRPVPNAEFLVWMNGKNIAIGTTGADGGYGLNVPYGDGQVFQTKAPKGYTLVSSSQVLFTTDASINTVTFTYRKGGI